MRPLARAKAEARQKLGAPLRRGGIKSTINWVSNLFFARAWLPLPQRLAPDSGIIHVNLINFSTQKVSLLCKVI